MIAFRRRIVANFRGFSCGAQLSSSVMNEVTQILNAIERGEPQASRSWRDTATT
jgi:hypothetical protein